MIKSHINYFFISCLIYKNICYSLYFSVPSIIVIMCIFGILVGAVNGLLDAGIAVPGEMAVTGCNNSEYATLCRPGLTSINNKAEVLSELSVQLLVDILAEKTEIAELVVIPELVVRGTS